MITVKCPKCQHEQCEEIYTIGDEWSLAMTICEVCNTDLAFDDNGYAVFLSRREPISVAVDIICYQSDNKILLIKRGRPPEFNKWALPGGFVESHETCEQAAVRELCEETCIDVDKCALTLVNVFSKPKRDPRGRVISILYAVEVAPDTKVIAGDDAKEAKFIDEDDILFSDLAFDHDVMYMHWYVTR